MTKSLSRFGSDAFRRQARRCYYGSVLMCTDDIMSFAQAHRLSPRAARWLQCTAEHLRARCDGGPDSPDNVVAACRYCNLRRHSRRAVARTPENYQRLVRKRVSRRRWNVPQVFEQGLIEMST